MQQQALHTRRGGLPETLLVGSRRKVITHFRTFRTAVQISRINDSPYLAWRHLRDSYLLTSRLLAFLLPPIPFGWVPIFHRQQILGYDMDIGILLYYSYNVMVHWYGMDLKKNEQ